MTTHWDPAAYARFGDHRTRPFIDLLHRIGATEPDLVVDLGCGNGPATMVLTQRWPSARVVGIDSSTEMLEAARGQDPSGRVEWIHGDIATWDPAALGARPDVIVTNAALQWIDGHRALIPRWLDALAPGGWFGMQVPGNFTAPSHQLMRDVAEAHPRRAEILTALQRPTSDAPEDYLATLLDAGARAADVWESTYLQVLDPEGASANPVLDWVSGTGLRPALQALTDDAERAAYVEAYAVRLARAYPRTPHGVVLPFRRIFAVAKR